MMYYEEEYDFDLGMVNGYRSRYDWVFPGRDNKSPEESPYAFDAFYVWRDKGIEGADPIYSDRMWQWDREKAQKAFGSHGQRAKKFSRHEAKKIIKAYYGKDIKCVGYALDCNRATGYEIGIFFVKGKENAKD